MKKICSKKFVFCSLWSSNSLVKPSEKLYTQGFLLGFSSTPLPQTSNKLFCGMNSAVPAGPDRCLGSLPENWKRWFRIHCLSTFPGMRVCWLLPGSQVTHPIVCPYAAQHGALAVLGRESQPLPGKPAAAKPSSPEDARQMIQLLCTLGPSALFLSTGVVLSAAILDFLSLLK